jgi:capsular exopolysaccharide synthesis family protein
LDGTAYRSPGGIAAPQPEGPAGELDIAELIGGVFRRWRLVVAVTLALLSATYGLLQVLPPRYQATVEVLMVDPQLRGIISRNHQPDATRAFDTVSVNTEIAIMKSATSLLRVVKDLRLQEIPEFQNRSRRARLFELSGLARDGWLVNLVRDVFGAQLVPDQNQVERRPDTEEERQKGAAEILEQHIRVQPEPLSYVLAVSATSRDPQLAQRLASSLVEQYLHAEQEARAKALDQVAIWLNGRLIELKSQIASTETAIEKLKSSTGLSDTGRGSVVQQQLADLNAQLMAVRADVSEKRARLEQARKLSTASAGVQDIPDTVASPLMSQLRAQQSTVTRQLAQLRAKLGDGHAEVVALTTQLGAINQAISNEAVHLLADLQNNFDIALRRKQEIEVNLASITAAQGDSGDAVRLQQLQRVAEADRKLYDAYMEQYNEIETTKSLASESERVISPATAPNSPVFPQRSLFLLGAVGLGGFLGLGLAFVLNIFHGRASLGAEAERRFGYPVVGNLPLIPRRELKHSHDLGRTLAQMVGSGSLSSVSEAIRGIRLSLHLSNLGRGTKVILVTSSLPGEGKSTLAVLLAASSAAAGRPTVLIDCDGRKSTISRSLGRVRPGLTELLAGAADLATVTIYDSEIGCDVISAGAFARSPGDLLASAQMAEVTERLRSRYDCVVIDSPPLLPVVDTRVLATIADQILMTVDGSYAHDVSVVEAMRLLRPESHRIAGIVFNKLAPEQIQRYGLYDYTGERSAVSAHL